jgi:hypothetical protein
MPRKLVELPTFQSMKEQCFAQLKSAFDSGKAIETDYSDASQLVKNARSHILSRKLPFKAHIKDLGNGVSIVWLEKRSATVRRYKRGDETAGYRAFQRLEDAFSKNAGIDANRNEAYILLTHARNYVTSRKLPFRVRIKTGNDCMSTVWLEKTSRRAPSTPGRSENDESGDSPLP